MQKYKEVQWWWYAILLVLAFFAGEHTRRVIQTTFLSSKTLFSGLIVIFKGDTTLPWYGYIVASSFFISHK